MADELWRKRSGWGRVGVVVVTLFGALILVGFSVWDVEDLPFLPNDAEASTTLDEGLALAEEGRWLEADLVFTEVIKLDPSDTDLFALAYINRSIVRLELGRTESAFADANIAIDLQPDDQVVLARAYGARGGCTC